jgi:hypothetical protein
MYKTISQNRNFLNTKLIVMYPIKLYVSNARIDVRFPAYAMDKGFM